MNSNIKARIERLEQQAIGNAEASELCLLVSFQAPGSSGQLVADQITDGTGKRWTRANDEDEAAFLARAKTEASKPASGSLKVLFADTASTGVLG